MKWAELTTAPSPIAEMCRELLIEHGIPAMIKPQDSVSFLGIPPMPCRLTVPEAMLGEASALLAEHGYPLGLNDESP